MQHVQESMEEAVVRGVFPGGVLLVSRGSDILIHQAFGHTDLTDGISVSTQTLYDLASLTKPLATTLAVMKLMERSQLALDDRLDTCMPSSKGTDKAGITMRQLLYHKSGLPDYRPYFKDLSDADPREARKQILTRILAEPLAHAPGEMVCYSDLGFILLRGVIEIVSGNRLDQYVQHEIYQPLGLHNLFFAGLESSQTPDRFAATEKCPWRQALIRGIVHDENTYSVGGIDGQAGLFGTAADVHGLLIEVLRTYNGDPSNNVFNPDTLKECLNFGRGKERALGFDRPAVAESAAGHLFSRSSVGHLGFTGTSFWMDLERSIVVILLTNRIHPTRENEKIRRFRPRIHDKIMEMLC
jgi:serine-type D-Ala-D-Ala carboxypeptidase